MRDQAAQSLRDFYEVIEKLRAPNGCPWDREQTHATLAPYLLEETYEMLEAISDGDSNALREELGDVLLQVFMHCTIAAENGEFDIGDVAQQVRAKMIHRHPHVFSDTSVSGAADVVVNWEKLKSQEKSDRESILDGVPRTLPSLAYAQAVQKRPARLGLDQWASIDEAAKQVDAALQMVRALAEDRPAPARGQDWVVREGEIARGDDAGDAQDVAPGEELNQAVAQLFWSSSALARLLRVDAEDVTRQAAADFARDFRRREAAAKRSGLDLHQLSREQWDALDD